MSDMIQTLYEAFLQCPEVSIDSRRIAAGGLFFGLAGEHVDGSEFGPMALDQGAKYAVVRHDSVPSRKGLIFVENPLATLQDLARRHRRELRIPVLGVTGSNGKTTTKELISRVLATTFKVRATIGNLNNHIGVPLTVLSVSNSDEIAIVEMGANHVGEIALLCSIASPTHGVITNIGRAHLEGFGGLEGVKKGKSELYDALAASGGVAFVNTDEAYLEDLSAHVHRRILYGAGDPESSTDALVRYRAEATKEGCTLDFSDNERQQWTVKSGLFGQYNLGNIAAAVVIGRFFRIPGAGICDAILNYEPRNNRSQTLLIGTNTCILDAYNANPSSMLAAIRSFREVSAGRKVLILGAMREMGDYADAVHLEIAQTAAEIDNAGVLLVGDEFKVAAENLGLAWYPDAPTLAAEMAINPPEHAHILIKGSRAMRLELLADALKGSMGAGE